MIACSIPSSTARNSRALLQPEFRLAQTLLVLALGVCFLALGSGCKSAQSRPKAQRLAERVLAGEIPTDENVTYVYDPLEVALASTNQVKNREAGIPVQCYTKTEGTFNPCWTCHTQAQYPNLMDDASLQTEYAFSNEGKINHWTNLFVDRSRAIQRISDPQILEYVRQDNYTPLLHSMRRAEKYAGYVPDLDFAEGFDAGGFAKDGSGWRAFRYKPFPGAFWPTNGATDDVMIRLPNEFRQLDGKLSPDVYRANLAVLEASFVAPLEVRDADIDWPCETLDEQTLGVDLDGDGKLERAATRLKGLPERYFGDAAQKTVRRAIYPDGTEFLHSVRYIDPDAPSQIARRMKELRYSKKIDERERGKILQLYEEEKEHRERGMLPLFSGVPAGGLRNDFGWMLQGFIEDERGRLRLQTHEEHWACMGCHSNIGVTLDQTFAFPRKVPGEQGWRYQDLRGIPDVPQAGHEDPEFLTYLKRVGGADELRSNSEVIERFMPDGQLDETELRRGATGGDRDLAYLVTPSRRRALELNKATLALVKVQRFERGRDVVLTPAVNVHQRIEQEDTGLSETNKVYLDGRLQLDWSRTAFVQPVD